MSLKHSYTLIAPIYDAIVDKPMAVWRQRSLNRVQVNTDQSILISGIGSGLDIPYLQPDAQYVGTDITPAMLRKAKTQADKRPEINIQLDIADSQKLPFDDNQFDTVILHLILAVVPEPTRALMESARVLKPGGKIYIFDKFIKSGDLAIFRKLINIFSRHIATRTDVVFEHVLSSCPQLTLIKDEPALANGWFRLIELEKQSN